MRDAMRRVFLSAHPSQSDLQRALRRKDKGVVSQQRREPDREDHVADEHPVPAEPDIPDELRHRENRREQNGPTLRQAQNLKERFELMATPANAAASGPICA